MFTEEKDAILARAAREAEAIMALARVESGAIMLVAARAAVAAGPACDDPFLAAAKTKCGSILAAARIRCEALAAGSLAANSGVAADMAKAEAASLPRRILEALLAYPGGASACTLAEAAGTDVASALEILDIMTRIGAVAGVIRPVAGPVPAFVYRFRLTAVDGQPPTPARLAAIAEEASAEMAAMAAAEARA